MSNRLRGANKVAFPRSKTRRKTPAPIVQTLAHQEIDALNKRARSLLHVSPRETQFLAESAREASTRLGYNKGLAESAGILAESLSRQADYAGAAQAFLESIEIAKRIGNHALHAVSLNAFGLMQINQGDYAKAMELCKDSLEIAVSINDANIQAAALTSVGVAYSACISIACKLEHLCRRTKCFWSSKARVSN